MERLCSVLSIVLAASVSLAAQTPAPPPQSARQALIEMFMGKGADAFEKHLPEVSRQTLIRKGETPETSVVLKISMIGRQLTAQGGHFETFETGPNLLVSEPGDGHERIEVSVEHDSLMGEEDEIELSIHAYKDGQPEALPVIPRLTFSLKQEKEIWRLTEVTVAAHVPLTDPDYLKSLRQQQDESSQSAVQMRVGIIAAAEGNYATRHPDRGYTCSLENLFAKDPQNAPGEAQTYYDPGQGGEEWNGYRFALSGCDGTPAPKYRIAAVPADADAGMKTFCADESGTVRFLPAGKSSNCLSRGQAVSKDAPAPSVVD